VTFEKSPILFKFKKGKKFILTPQLGERGVLRKALGVIVGRRRYLFARPGNSKRRKIIIILLKLWNKTIRLHNRRLNRRHYYMAIQAVQHKKEGSHDIR
jgi:hypothetical protein